MKMDVVAGSGNDEFYTLIYAIKPLITHIRSFGRKVNKSIIDNKVNIWCPFDTADSYYVKLFLSEGFGVMHSHIDDSVDFFSVATKKFIKDNNIDVIISNPPYSCKTEILERLFELDKPFAMLVGFVGLFESKRRFELFKNNEFEIMCFDKRISYLKSYQDEKPLLNPPFSSVYVCHKFLEIPRVFEQINKKDVHNI